MATERATIVAKPGTAQLLREAWRLREVLDEKVGDDRYDPAVHLARRYSELMLELTAIQESEDAGKIESTTETGQPLVFQSRLTPGRKGLDKDKLTIALLEAGVKAETIAAAVVAATTEGVPFWTRTIQVRVTKGK